MIKVTIQFNTDNAAFRNEYDDSNIHTFAVAQTIEDTAKKVADKIRQEGTKDLESIIIREINGNRVGRATIEATPED